MNKKLPCKEGTLIGWQRCGCMGIALALDLADKDDLSRVKRTIKRRGYEMELLTREEAKSRPWVCPEHQALRTRLALKQRKP